MGFAAAGFLFGLIGGMGMGGGVVLIPVLTLLFGAGQQAAQGMNLLAFLPMSGFALLAHARAGRVRARCALPLAAAGLVGALLGAFLAALAAAGLLRRLFGGALIALGLYRGALALRRSRAARS